MITKIFTAAVALMLGFTFSAFAGDNEKGDTKKVSEEPKAENSESTTASLMYWFDTDASGTALSDPTGIPSSDPQTPPLCDGGSANHCQKGFTEGQTTVVDGRRLPSIPVSAGVSARYP